MMRRWISLAVAIIMVISCGSLFAYAEVADDPLADNNLNNEIIVEDVVIEETSDTAMPIVDDTVNENVISGADETEPENADVVYKKELDVLSKLEILDMEIDDYTSAISRAEFVEIVARLCGYNYDKMSVSEYFKDVSEEHPNGSAIAYAAGLKLIIGNGSEFRPDDAILAEEAGIVLMRALGYDNFSPYINIDMVKAKREGIFDGIAVSYNQALSFEAAVKMIYNAMNTEMIVINGVTVGAEGSALQLEKGATTLLNYYMHIYRVEDILTDNGCSSLSGESQFAYDKVKIGGTAYKINDNSVYDLLGHKVEAYHNEENVLLYIADITDDSDVLYISAEDIISATMGKVQYANKSNKVSTVSFPLDAKIVYNGKALKPGEYTQQLLNPKFGGIKLIKTFGSSYDLVVVTSEYNCVVDKVQINNDIVSVLDIDTIDKNFQFDINELGDNIRIADAYGSEISYKDLSQYNVLSVAKSVDGEFISIKVSTSKVSGVIERIYSKDNMVITINNIPYTFAHGADTSDVAANIYGDCYLDIYGNVAYFNSLAKYEKRFAYLIAARATDGFNPQFAIKILDETGKVLTFVAEKRIIVDGLPVKETGFSALADRFYVGDEFQPCVVKYELNLDGSLKALDTTLPGSNGADDSLRKITAKKTTEYSSGMFYGFTRYEFTPRMFDGGIFVNDNTIVFGIPRGTQYSDEDYRKFTRNYFIQNRYYDVEFYTDDPECDTAKVATVKYSPKYDSGILNEKGYVLLPSLHGSGMNTAVVNEVVTALDDKGDIVQQVEITDLLSNTVYTYPLRWEEQADQLCKGMVVRYYLVGNRIIDIEPVFDLNTRTAMTPRDLNAQSGIKTFYVRQNGRDLADNSATEATTSLTYVAWQLTYLDVISLKGDMLVGVAGDASVEWKEEEIDRTSTIPLSYVYRYNSKSGDLTGASLDDICGYDDAGNGCSKVVALYKTAALKALIILD